MSPKLDAEDLDAEDLAYWYLRLNGFLCLRNFLVHGDRRGEDRTKIDVVGVRFRHRREHLNRPMIDDDWIERPGRTIVVFCDAKTGAQDFNPTWMNQPRRIMESFLALVGVIPKEHWEQVAHELYGSGRSEPSSDLLITALLIHHDPQRRVLLRWKSAEVVQLEHALRFVHRRFKAYDVIKSSHEQWERSGHSLWALYERYHWSEDKFVKVGLNCIGCSGTETKVAEAGLPPMSDESPG
jgi:hypothetical protein